MPKITFILPNQTTSFEAEMNALLSDILVSHGQRVDMPCAGKGRCGKCRVKAEGNLSPVTEEEQNALTEKELKDSIRLACCTRILGDVRIWPNSKETSQQIRVDSIANTEIFKPLYHHYGVAIDIGTTTLAAALYGKNGLLATASGVNPQRVFGADVISRIEASMNGKAKELAVCVREEIANLLLALAQKAKIAESEIDALVITGNTAMLHLFAEEDPTPLSAAPFEAKELFGKTVDAKLFHLPCHTEATIYFPQCISAFVGADITTALLASEICRKKETAILIDIGTNGEMALLHEGTLRCCSTAAGPAFEGAGLSCGMAGENGAIDHISVTDNRMQIHVIGEEEAKGICGSGIVDALSALKRLDIMDETGCLNEDEAVCLQDDVCITQKDIRMVQLAKSAVCAGAYTLLQTAGVTPDKINTLAIAGGFGSYLDLHEAAHIGLYPHELEHNAKVLGNAALSGASMILENSDLMEESEQIAKMCDTIDLSTNPIFMEQYIECMEF